MLLCQKINKIVQRSLTKGVDPKHENIQILDFRTGIYECIENLKFWAQPRELFSTSIVPKLTKGKF